MPFLFILPVFLVFLLHQLYRLFPNILSSAVLVTSFHLFPDGWTLRLLPVSHCRERCYNVPSHSAFVHLFLT